MDALYFRVSTDRQSTEKQLGDLLEVAKMDGSGRDWTHIDVLLSRVVVEEEVGPPGSTRTIHRVNPQIAEQLAGLSVYVEQGRSRNSATQARTLLRRLERDAHLSKFDRLLVRKVSHLGRDTGEVVSTVYRFSHLGITVVPIKSTADCIDPTMARPLWVIQGWLAEISSSVASESARPTSPSVNAMASARETWSQRSS